jgi:WD40 repeat protein
VAVREELGGEIWGLIQHLANERLVVTGRDAQGHETAEVVHEALIQKWGRFQEWMDTDRAFRAWQERLRGGLRQWQESGGDEGALLRGTPLGVAENWLAERARELSEAEVKYIQESNALQERQQTERERLQAEREHRRRVTLTGLAVGLLITLILSLVAFQQRQEALTQRENSMRQAAILLAGQAENELADGYYDRAILLALAALEYYPYTPQAEHALGQAVSYNRALQIYSEHQSAVTSVAWSPDGTKIASSSTDNTVRVWDPSTGDDLLIINLPEGITGNIYDQALSVKWSPDGKHLLTVSGDRWTLGSQDFDLILWDALTGVLLTTIDIPNLAKPEAGDLGTWYYNYATSGAAAYAPESGRLATLAGDDSAIIWDASLLEQEFTLAGHTNDVNAVAWSPDERFVATASEDGTARIWDAQTGEEILVLRGHEGGVNALVWSPGGDQLATAGADGTVRFWDTGNGMIVRTLEAKAGIVWSLAWSPNGMYLATGTEDTVIRIWEIKSGEVIAILKGHRDFISDLVWSPVDDRLASADAKNTSRIWNVAPSTAAQTLPYRTVSGFDWSSDGHYLALPVGDIGVYGTNEPGGLAIWDAQIGQPVTNNLDTIFDYSFTEADYSPDDSLLLVKGLRSWPDNVSDMETINVLNAHSGRLIKSFTITDGHWIRSECWSPDGTKVAGGNTNGVLYLWDFKTGELLNTVVGHMQEGMMINYVEWSPDGMKIATASDDGTARIWNADTGEPLLVLAHEQPTFVSNVAWSPDGARILSSSGSPDFGSQDTTIRIWDAESGAELLVIRGHNRTVSMANWSADGKRIVSTSSDGTTRIWDAATGDELLILSTPSIYFNATYWSPDGKYIAVAMEKSPMEIWRVWQTTQELVEYAKGCCVIRELTEAERMQFGLK